MSNNNVYNTKKLVETAILSAISVIIIFLTINMPLFDIIGLFLLPIPTALLYTRNGYKYSVASVIVSSLITMFISNPIVGICMGVLYGLIGIVLGYCISSKKKFSTMILALFITCVLVNTAFIFINIKLVEKDSIRSVVQKQVQITKKTYDSIKPNSSGLPLDQQTQLKQMENTMFSVDSALKLLPFGIVLISLISAILNYFISTSIMKKLKVDVVERQPFSEFYFESKTGIFLIVVVILGLILHYSNIPAGDYMLNALIIMTALIFVIEGMAVTTYFFRNKLHFSRFTTVIFIIIIFTTPLILLFLYLGITDLIIDFRKIFKYRKKQ